MANTWYKKAIKTLFYVCMSSSQSPVWHLNEARGKSYGRLSTRLFHLKSQPGRDKVLSCRPVLGERQQKVDRLK